jgi:gas vesicle protein
MAENNSGSLIGWFVGGAVLGAAVALLLAPDTGEATRRKLTSRAKESGRALSQSGQEAVEKGRELYQKGRQLAEEAADLFEKGKKIAEKRVGDAV